MFLLILNLGGLTIGPVLPGLLNDRVFHNGNMIGYSLSITIALSAAGMLILLWETCRAYRRHASETAI